ncbi:hypothetical protein QBC37DRAFT_321083 [Rhypophila decipiens]|uniref:Methyltransferase type 11 domain-containing protein n=1 Tax=Rhypophila decipiens TaxID=261697 RepID=A0AAN6Y495_9PEZI|nr:hypothetical protein QBC37DRAFT_321083 [Rhypophila decipiens]
MEFLSGYAAARAPLSAYQVEPHTQTQSSNSNRPARSNSTSGSTSGKKRSRAAGHIRTSSASTTSSSRTEVQSSSSSSTNPQKLSWLQQPVVTATSATDGTTTPTPAEHQHRIFPRRDTRERMTTPSTRYLHNKQLPATPRLETHDTSFKYLHAGSASEPSSARTPASATGPIASTIASDFAAAAAAISSQPDRRMLHHATMFADAGSSSKAGGNAAPRAESISSVSGATTVSSRTMLSSEQPSSAELAAQQNRPFVVRNGRTYIADPTLPYPLPVDLEELHRQSLRTLLLMQLFGRPICSPEFANKPPARVLEVGCGAGFWSTMCYKYYEKQGQHTNISFTGIDIAPIAPGANVSGNTSASGSGSANNRPSPSSSTTSGDDRPEKDMKWRFVQHDLRKLPWPFQDGEFDLVMVKDMSLATVTLMQQTIMDEYLRILSPGGTIEIWDSDHTLRMLRPHVPEPSASSTSAAAGTATSTDNEDSEDSSSDEDEQRQAASLGAYLMTANTPLSGPLNNFLVEYNGWISRALEKHSLSPVPCTLVGPCLLQEAEILTGVGNRRLAVPLSEVRWEREGVGGVVTKDGKSYIETKGRKSGKEGITPGKGLEPGAAALRRTALLTVVQMIQSLEHLLREESGKSQDEWDGWMGKMMNDLVKENGTSWGECLEVGAWWARKRASA